MAQKVAESPLLEAAEESAFLKQIGAKDNVLYQNHEAQCKRCLKWARIEQIIVFGWKEMETAACPVCGEELYSAMCFTMRAVPVKKL